LSKKFLTDVIQQSSDLTGVAAGRLAADVVAAIKAEIIETGRFSLPDFGSFTVRETPKRTAKQPRQRGHDQPLPARALDLQIGVIGSLRLRG
jgi:DNA-binding protein HU-beta